ncbi:MAG: hypothetical protein KAG98_01800, partial [Lentisphaeria bacterium]|nr:hypothetical protein [Lentisphaeria bacterium]
ASSFGIFGGFTVMKLSTEAKVDMLFLSIGVLFCLVAIHSTYRFINPLQLFKCDHLGLYLGNKRKFVEWKNVVKIEVGEMKISRKTNGEDAYSPAVIFKYKSISYKTFGIQSSEARFLDANTFGLLSHEPEKVIDRINQFRASCGIVDRD